MFFYPTPSHRLNLIIIVNDLILYFYQHQLLIRSISTQTQKKINKGPLLSTASRFTFFFKSQIYFNDFIIIYLKFFLLFFILFNNNNFIHIIILKEIKQFV